MPVSVRAIDFDCFYDVSLYFKMFRQYNSFCFPFSNSHQTSLMFFSRVATKWISAYSMMNVVRASGRQLFHFRTISYEWNVTCHLAYTSLVVRGGSLLILRIVGQRSRSQLLKIEPKFDTFFASARYLRNKMEDINETWYTYVCWWEEEAYWYWGL